MLTNPERPTIYPAAVMALTAEPGFTPGAGVALAADATGLRLTRDGGRTWQRGFHAADLPPDLIPTALAAGHDRSGQPMLLCGVHGGLLRSLDAGATWEVCTPILPPPAVSALVCADDGLAYAATLQDGVLRSTDSGLSWQQWNFGLLDWRVLALAACPQTGDLIAGTETGAALSRNQGRSWHMLPLPGEPGPVISVAWASGTLYAGTEAGCLYHSADHGATWQQAALPAEAGPVNAVITGVEGRLLALCGTRLLAPCAGATWAQPPFIAHADAVSACAAPAGLAPGAVLLVGGLDAEVVAYPLPESLC